MSVPHAAAEPPPRLRALSPVPDEREELAALHETALGLIERLDLGELLEPDDDVQPGARIG